MYSVEVVTRSATATLAVKASLGMLQMAKVMGQSYQAILAQLEAQGLAPAGPPYARYTGLDWTELDKQGKLKMLLEVFTKKWNVEMGFPLSTPPQDSAGLSAGSLPAGRYLQTLHRGPYQKVASAYKRLQAEARLQGLKLAPESLEIYLNDPRSTAKADLETLVLILLED